MVAAPKHIGLGRVLGEGSWDLSPPGAPGRSAGAWAKVGAGLLCLSAYFWHSEGWSGRNQELLEHTAGVARRLGAPWVLAADFNMEPEVFQQHSVVADLKVVVVRPEQGTCFGQG
eukprot:11173761-Lingulodinium_polyedra.AAC.1